MDAPSTSLRPVRILVAALVGVFVTAFPTVILVATLPAIAQDLGTSEGLIAWVITAPMVVGAVLLPTMGRLGDVYGHRRVFLVAVSTAGVFAALSALAWDAWSLIAFRTVSQAVGNASLPAAIALLMAAYRGEGRNRALGWWAFVSSASPSLGLAFGGPVVAAVGWRGVFACQVVAALVGVVFARGVLRETERHGVASFDLVGGACLMLATGGLLVALDQVADLGPASPVVAACVALVLVAGAAFTVVERRSDDPMVSLDLLRRRAFATPLGVEAVMQACNMGVFFITPFILHDDFGHDAGAIALLMLPLPLGMCVFSPLGGRLSWRLGSRQTALLGCVGLLASVVALDLAVRWGSLALVLVAITGQGAGCGLLRPATAATMSHAVDERAMGVGMAMLRMLGQVGGALGITLTVAATRLGGSEWALLVGAGFALIGSVATLAMPRARGGRDPGRGPGPEPEPSGAATLATTALEP